MKLIYFFNGTYSEFCKKLDMIRDPDGVARNVLIRKCIITEIPVKIAESIYNILEELNIENSKFIYCEFIAEGSRATGKLL